MSFEMIGFIMCYLNRDKGTLFLPEAEHGFSTVIGVLHGFQYE